MENIYLTCLACKKNRKNIENILENMLDMLNMQKNAFVGQLLQTNARCKHSRRF